MFVRLNCLFHRKSKKDDVLKKQYKEKKKKENLEETTKQDDEYTKTIKNADEYQKWFERKGKPKKNLPPPTLTQRYMTCTVNVRKYRNSRGRGREKHGSKDIKIDWEK